MRTVLLHISCKIVFEGSGGHVSIASATRAEVFECEPWGPEGAPKPSCGCCDTDGPRSIWQDMGEQMRSAAKERPWGSSLTLSVHAGVAGGDTNTFLLPK